MPSVSQKRAQGKDKHGGHSSHGAAPDLPNVLSRVFVRSCRPSSCRRRLRMRSWAGSDQLSGTLAKSTEGRVGITPVPWIRPESLEAWRRAIEGGAEGEGPSDGRLGCR